LLGTTLTGSLDHVSGRWWSGTLAADAQLEGWPCRSGDVWLSHEQARSLVENGAVEVMTPFRVTEIRKADEKALRVLGDHASQPAPPSSRRRQ
jgi:hypothetical protein